MTYPGLFAGGGLDVMTRALLEALPPLPSAKARVLDFACGSGAIAAVISRKSAEKSAEVISRGHSAAGHTRSWRHRHPSTSTRVDIRVTQQYDHASTCTQACPRVHMLDADAFAIRSARKNVPSAEVFHVAGWPKGADALTKRGKCARDAPGMRIRASRYG